MAVESRLAFYPRRAAEIVTSAASGLRLGRRIVRIWRRVRTDPATPIYADIALAAAAADGCGETLEMFEATDGPYSRHAAARYRHDATASGRKTRSHHRPDGADAYGRDFPSRRSAVS
jgi:hypothetical protein